MAPGLALILPFTSIVSLGPGKTAREAESRLSSFENYEWDLSDRERVSRADVPRLPNTLPSLFSVIVGSHWAIPVQGGGRALVPWRQKRAVGASTTG